MKGSTIGGMLTGLALGAAALTAFNMMSHSNQQKVRSFAMRSGHKIAEKANEMMGK